MAEQVHIYSGEWDAYWRPDGCGYTMSPEQAGTWAQTEAERRIAGCGPEKLLRLIPVTPEVSLYQAARSVLENNGGPVDSIYGTDTHVMVRIEDFEALEAAFKRAK